MTPHRQLIQHNPAKGQFGDCYRTCVASILDLQPAEVPHFYSSDTETVLHQLEQARQWLNGWGLSLACFAYMADGMTLDDVLRVMGGNCPGVPMVLSGSSRSGCNHSVVIMDGAIVSDPSGGGIVGPMDSNQWQIDVVTVCSTWGGRLIEKRGVPPR